MQGRDHEILVTLTHRIRVLTLNQAARTWWGGTADPLANARRGLAKLARGGLLSASTALARPELTLTEPAATWTPGSHAPSFDALAYQLHSRWTQALRPTRFFVATRPAANALGGFGGPLAHPLHLSHDLHISTVYLRIRQSEPDTASNWISERHLAQFRRHQKLPDAGLGHSPESLLSVIEFGNGYDAGRLRAFHADCAERSLAYQIW